MNAVDERFPQSEYLQALQSAVDSDTRIRAAWLEGSLGRGNADRYSDIDLHLLMDKESVESFREGAEAWLSAIRPLVLYRLMFNGAMINALTLDGLRLDAWLHTDETIAIDERKAQIWIDREGALTPGKRPEPPQPAALATRLEQQIAEFWRCIALTPSVVGRGELIVATMGLGIELTLLSEVLITGYEIERDSGVKRLNEFLPPGAQSAIEQALVLGGLSASSLAHAQLGLAGIMSEEGRKIAARHGFAYPAEMEAAVLEYVSGELAAIGIPIPMGE
jgi:hypothetical protein